MNFLKYSLMRSLLENILRRNVGMVRLSVHIVVDITLQNVRNRNRCLTDADHVENSSVLDLVQSLRNQNYHYINGCFACI